MLFNNSQYITDPCLPNPCQNEGMCSVGFGGIPICLCTNYFTGRFCSIPPQSNCPGDLCATPNLYVRRSDYGDIVSVPNSFEGYCLGIGGYCAGESGSGPCPYCQCQSTDVYQYSTSSCVDLNQGKSCCIITL